MKKLLAALMIVIGLGVIGTTEAAAETRLEEKRVTAVSGCDASAIQKILNKNKTGKYHLILEIPAGTYELTRTLYVYPNTTILASSKAWLVKQSRYGAMLETKLVDDKGGYNGNYNITIDGGIWDSTPLMYESAGTETFRFIHSRDITIRNLVLCNVPEGSHLITFAGVQNAVVENCTLYGYGDNGDDILTPKEAIQLDTVHSAQQVPTSQSARITWDDLPCDKITVTGCKFYQYSRGIGSHTAVAGVMHTNVKITGNEFRDLTDSAIRLYNYKNAEITKNTISNVVEGILVYTYMEAADGQSYFQPLNHVVQPLPSNYHITISDNKIQNVKILKKDWGDGIRVIGSRGRPMTGVSITGNTISAAGRYGIFVTTAPQISVIGNTVKNSKQHGILLEENCRNAKIYGNQVTGAGDSGIAVYYSDGVSIYSNTIAKPKENGIYLIQSKKCQVGKKASVGNTITNPGKRGIYLTKSEEGNTGCTETVIQYNTIKNAGTDGIGTYLSSKVTIKKNKITAAGNGIKLEERSRYAKITDNQILKYAKNAECYGILLSQSGGSKSKKVTVSGNKIQGQGKGLVRDAVRLTQSSYVVLTKNNIISPAGCGILLDRSKWCTVGKSKSSYNTIKNARGCGIYLVNNSSNSSVQYNRIASAGQDAIAVYQTRNAAIKRNQVSSKQSGIYVNMNSAYCTVSGNTITSAGRYGIWIFGRSRMAAVKENTIKKYGTSGKYYGIYIDQAGGLGNGKYTKISSNKIYGSGKRRANHGIKVQSAAYTRIEGNTVSSPPGYGICVVESKRNIIQKNRVMVRSGLRGISISKSNYSIIKSNTIRNAKKGQDVVISKSIGCTWDKNKKK